MPTSLNPSFVRRFASEVVGTALLVGIGTGTVVVAARVGGIPQWAMGIAWFLAVLLPVVLFVEVSGAHLNPAVTLALAVSRRIAWKLVPEYWAGQFLGAFAASLAVLSALGDSADLGATVPVHTSLALAFLGEAAFTALLVAMVFVLADRGEGIRRWRTLLPPSAVGLSTFIIGPWTGSSLNPARTLAPAIVSGTYLDLWLYLIAVPSAAVTLGVAWKPKSVDVDDRGPGRETVSR